MNRWIRALIALWVFYVVFSALFVVTFERSATAGIMAVERDLFPVGTVTRDRFNGAL